MITIKDRIKELRKEKNLTQEELAKLLGLNAKSSIANYESGANSPSDEIKNKMCEIFNCTMDYLMGKTQFRTTDDFYHEIDSTFKSIFYEKYVLSLSNLGVSNDDAKKILDIYFITPKYDDMINNIDNVVAEKNNTLDTILKKYPLETDKKILKVVDEFLNSKKTVLTEVINETNSTNELNNKSSKFYNCPVYGKISAGLPNWAEECLEGYLPIDPNLMGIINPEECFFLRVDGESMNKVIRNGAYALIRKQDIVENGEIAAVLVNGFDATLKKFSKQGNLVILEPMSEDSSFTTQVYNKDTQIKILGKYIGKFEMN